MYFIESQEMAAAAAATVPVTSPTDEGLCAVALYDYQAAAEDEISFDPNDIISNIEMVSCFIGALTLSSGKFSHLCRACL